MLTGYCFKLFYLVSSFYCSKLAFNISIYTLMRNCCFNMLILHQSGKYLFLVVFLIYVLLCYILKAVNIFVVKLNCLFNIIIIAATTTIHMYWNATLCSLFAAPLPPDKPATYCIR